MERRKQMNNFIKFILGVFKSHLLNIFVIQNNKEYTYKYVYDKSIAFAIYLNNKYDERVRILLVAPNSLEWIICFIGIILSKHKLVLISPKLDISIINSTIIHTGVTMVICEDSLKLIPFIEDDYDILLVSKIKIMSNSDINEKEYLEELSDQQNYLITINKSEIIPINYDTIVEKLINIGRQQIFTDTSIYIGKTEFTYNYILGLLLPFAEGITIVIPHKEEDIFGVKNSLLQYQPEVVILTARQFKALYREYIDCPENRVNEVLRNLELWFIRKLFLKNNVKKLFPRLKQLIILNSKLDYYIETILKRLKIPFTVTLGEIDSCGISTYYSPIDYRAGMISDYYNDNIESVEGFEIITSNIEDEFSSNPLIEESLLIQKNNGNLYLYVKVNMQHANYLNKSLNEIALILERHRLLVNRKSFTAEKIVKVIPMLVNFEHDEYDRINKKLYKNENLRISI